jgi:hydrogenase nickel incorporation protein HypB
VIKKIDRLPYVTFNTTHFERGVQMLNPGVTYFQMSRRGGDGLEAWLGWLRAEVRAYQGNNQ